MNKSYNTIGTVAKSNRITVETDAPNIHNIHGPHPVPSINTCTLIKEKKKRRKEIDGCTECISIILKAHFVYVMISF